MYLYTYQTRMKPHRALTTGESHVGGEQCSPKPGGNSDRMLGGENECEIDGWKKLPRLQRFAID